MLCCYVCDLALIVAPALNSCVAKECAIPFFSTLRLITPRSEGIVILAILAQRILNNSA